MNRREFLSSVSAAALLAALPLPMVMGRVAKAAVRARPMTFFCEMGLRTGLNDGTSWENAFHSLERALEFVKSNDTLYVEGQETFTETIQIVGNVSIRGAELTFDLEEGAPYFNSNENSWAEIVNCDLREKDE